MGNTRFKSYLESCSGEDLKKIALELIGMGIMSIQTISTRWYPNNLAQKACRETADSIHNLPILLSQETIEEHSDKWPAKRDVIFELELAARQLVRLHKSEKGISINNMTYFEEWEAAGYNEELMEGVKVY